LCRQRGEAGRGRRRGGGVREVVQGAIAPPTRFRDGWAALPQLPARSSRSPTRGRRLPTQVHRPLPLSLGSLHAVHGSWRRRASPCLCSPVAYTRTRSATQERRSAHAGRGDVRAPRGSAGGHSDQTGTARRKAAQAGEDPGRGREDPGRGRRLPTQERESVHKNFVRYLCARGGWQGTEGGWQAAEEAGRGRRKAGRRRSLPTQERREGTKHGCGDGAGAGLLL
jgi:hypothetical protein